MNVLWHTVGMDEVPVEDDWLSPTEGRRLAQMRFAKRRTEFRLARWTAKALLASVLGLSEGATALARLEIRPGPDGAPRPYLDGVPARVSMSMSDRADWAVCLAGRVDAALGCDLELVEPRSSLFVGDFLTRAEQDEVARAGVDRHVVANLVWSAKESALKVLHTGLRRDTRSVEVDVGNLAATAYGRVPGWHQLHVRDRETGRRFPGWWQRFDDFLLTTAASGPFPPPRALGDPHRLRSAQPSHGWLEQG